MRRRLQKLASSHITVLNAHPPKTSSMWTSNPFLLTCSRFCSFGEDGFRNIYAQHNRKVEETKPIPHLKITEDPSQGHHQSVPRQTTISDAQHDVPQIITPQLYPGSYPPPYQVNPLPQYTPIVSTPAEVPLKEISSFLALFQYCSDHNLRFLLLLVGGLSCGLIDLWTSALYLGVVDENKFIPPAFLFYLFGLCNGRALALFCISILLYKLPTHLSFIVQDERGISTRPSAIRWRVGKYEISSSILFSIGVAVSFVRLTIPLQLFFARMVFSV